MSAAKIFISHTTADDAIVTEIRKALEGQGLPTSVDSREFAPGDDLKKKVFNRIEQSRHFMVVLSLEVMNSEWVDKEIKHALKVEKQRTDGYKLIPILLKGVRLTALHRWFGKNDPFAVRIGNGHDAVANALPDLLAAVGELAPSDSNADTDHSPAPSANLTLKLSDLTLPTARDKHRAKAKATLIYTPPTPSAPRVESPPYKLTAPLAPIEVEELR